MKRLVSLAVVVLFVASTMPVFAGEGCGTECKGKCCMGVQLPFQRIADTMKLGKAKPKNQLRSLYGKTQAEAAPAAMK